MALDAGTVYSRPNAEPSKLHSWLLLQNARIRVALLLPGTHRKIRGSRRGFLLGLRPLHNSCTAKCGWANATAARSAIALNLSRDVEGAD